MKALTKDRVDLLVEKRNLKMAQSAHAFVRGSTKSFYEWLETSKGRLPDGPPVWICGDCHVGNLGPLADSKGRVAIQIRDLDQTVIGNPAHDIVRLGLSLAFAARGSDLPGVTTARILEELIAAYVAALGADFSKEQERSHRPKAVQSLLHHAVRRRWHHLAMERLETVKPELPLGKKYWKLKDTERAALADLFEIDDIHHMLTQLRGRADKARIEMVDAAYWVKGCSSLGRLRYAVMLKVDKGHDAEFCLVDVKEAIKAAAPCDLEAVMPKDNAERLVAGAKELSPNLGQRMIAGRLMGRSVVMRELMPQDLKIEADQLSQDEAIGLARYLAVVVGHAHGRQMDAPTRQHWKKQLTSYRSIEIDAPSWLWSNVVDLISIHEAAYLEHCRRFALTEAA